jgi:hypothetical protein
MFELLHPQSSFLQDSCHEARSAFRALWPLIWLNQLYWEESPSTNWTGAVKGQWVGVQSERKYTPKKKDIGTGTVIDAVSKRQSPAPMSAGLVKNREFH